MTLVVDASVLVEALIEKGSRSVWAEQMLASDDLAAPHHMPAEVANVLRLGILSGAYAERDAEDALHYLASLRVVLFPYEALTDRIWQLRHTVTPYDAWYVALAEALDASLATLDFRLTRAPGPRCEFLTYEP